MVEVRNPKKTVVILPKEKFLELEKQAIILEAMEAIEKSKGKKKYTSAEVESMLAEVWQGNL
ncbi:MAG: hypothetical protein HQM11_08940 [SAR324 cluster bacterium]|nr:hypothetical protein [SAR324 cluster bacterium]